MTSFVLGQVNVLTGRSLIGGYNYPVVYPSVNACSLSDYVPTSYLGCSESVTDVTFIFLKSMAHNC